MVERIWMGQNAKPDGGCHRGVKGCPAPAFLGNINVLLGSEKHHPLNGLTQSRQQHSPFQQLALAGTYGSAAPELQPQSAPPSVTLPHPTPDASSNEANNRHPLQLLG